MKIAIGTFIQESHSFSPVPGSWDHFCPGEILEGQSIIHQTRGTRTEEGGILDNSDRLDFQIVPLLYARASASAGPIKRSVFEQIRDRLLGRLHSVGSFDGVILMMHGAMVADGYDDATGEVLKAVRHAIGADKPLFVTLDLHANVTNQIVNHVNAVIGYHTAPHVDQYETGLRALGLMNKIYQENIRLKSGFCKIPMILPGENGRTDFGPYAKVMTMVKETMRNPGVLDASAFSVQPWLDVKDVGCSTIVISDGNKTLAQQHADRIADEFWSQRSAFAVQLTPTRQAIRVALESWRYPFILSDSADAPSSGAPGDSPIVLRELLKIHPTKDCYLNIVDPAAVERMASLGVGREVSVQLGGRFASAFYKGVKVNGEVIYLTDGDFVHKGPAGTGMVIHRGLTGVLKVDHLFIEVMSRPVFQWDPELYRSVGLEPREAQIVVVKSPAAFRAAYEPFAAEIINIDAPGVCSPNLHSYEFRNVRRPLYPLDDIQNWRAVDSMDVT
jgi:microcystin degradation protein MlrC